MIILDLSDDDSDSLESLQRLFRGRRFSGPQSAESKAMINETMQTLIDRIADEPDEKERVGIAGDFLFKSLGTKDMGMDMDNGPQERSKVFEEHGFALLTIMMKAIARAKEMDHWEEVYHGTGCAHGDMLRTIIKTLDSPIDAEDKIAHIKESITPRMRQNLLDDD